MMVSKAESLRKVGALLPEHRFEGRWISECAHGSYTPARKPGQLLGFSALQVEQRQRRKIADEDRAFRRISGDLASGEPNLYLSRPASIGQQYKAGAPEVALGLSQHASWERPAIIEGL